MSSITVRTPATTANLGPGFDCLGLALQLHNLLTITPIASGIEVRVAGEGAGTLPQDASNVVVSAMRHLFDTLGRPFPPVRVCQQNAIPVARGLGSSSAAIAAGLTGANALAGNPFSQSDLVDMAAALDGHPDNAVACLLGGLVVTAMDGTRVHYARLAVPDALQVVLFIPEFETSTPAARLHLPDTYSRDDTIFTLSRSALTTAAFASARWDLLRIGMQDRIHQPYRTRAYPQMPHLIEAALDAGAFGAALSGSGPTIAAFVESDGIAVGRAMQAAGSARGLSGRTVCVPIDREGARATCVQP